jgi:quinol monooxygenase YgiN
MNIAHFLLLGASVVAASVCGPAIAADVQGLYVQEAEIEIDPTQLDAYESALSEHIEMATRVEPGVLGLYAVSERDNPARVRVFEIYRNLDAYRSHLETAHFKKYKATVQQMVRSLKVIQTTPIAFATKP